MARRHLFPWSDHRSVPNNVFTLWWQTGRHTDRQAWSNSVEPDQTPHYAASDQGLHCLPLIHCLTQQQSVNGLVQRRTSMKSKCPNISGKYIIWAATSENVPFGSALSEDSDQHMHSRSLIKIFTGRILDRDGCKVSWYGQRKLIRCESLFEFSLSAHVRRCVFSRRRCG